MPQLAGWETFYVIVGSSAAALTGLMFVVVTLIKESDIPRSSGTVAAFGTPTVVHFCAALVVAAVLTAPWRTPTNVAAAVGIVGAAGLIYTLMVVQRARKQTSYQPVLEDWLFHTALPIAAYAAILIAAAVLRSDPEHSLFGIGAAVLALVLIGIHNSWDTVTYVTVARPEQKEAQKP
jgi:hypothetical protein